MLRGTELKLVSDCPFFQQSARSSVCEECGSHQFLMITLASEKKLSKEKPVNIRPVNSSRLAQPTLKASSMTTFRKEESRQVRANFNVFHRQNDPRRRFFIKEDFVSLCLLRAEVFCTWSSCEQVKSFHNARALNPQCENHNVVYWISPNFCSHSVSTLKIHITPKSMTLHPLKFGPLS